jgi:hypothetical protein
MQWCLPGWVGERMTRGVYIFLFETFLSTVFNCAPSSEFDTANL